MSQIEISTIGAMAAIRIVGATLAMSACKGNLTTRSIQITY